MRSRFLVIPTPCDTASLCELYRMIIIFTLLLIVIALGAESRLFLIGTKHKQVHKTKDWKDSGRLVL